MGFVVYEPLVRVVSVVYLCLNIFVTDLVI
jgi:hypothetical protein